MGWKLGPVCPQPLLQLLSVNKGDKANLERQNSAQTSTHHFGPLMLLAAGRRRLQGARIYSRHRSEALGQEESAAVFYSFLLSPQLL